MNPYPRDFTRRRNVYTLLISSCSTILRRFRRKRRRFSRDREQGLGHIHAIQRLEGSPLRSPITSSHVLP
ncbi:uncharacterized protein J3R85_006117 [Psidium guajava]|nr:uncharacterized protein J3R85_006117 [Psidium guajava]